MISKIELNNLINQLPAISQLAKKYDLGDIFLVQPICAGQDKLHFFISETKPLDICAKIAVDLCDLLKITIDNDDDLSVDSWETFEPKYLKQHYGEKEISLLKTPCSEIITFLKEIFKFEYNLKRSEPALKERKRNIEESPDNNATQVANQHKKQRLASEPNVNLGFFSSTNNNIYNTPPRENNKEQVDFTNIKHQISQLSPQSRTMLINQLNQEYSIQLPQSMIVTK